jgi:hypothetical protein
LIGTSKEPSSAIATATTPVLVSSSHAAPRTETVVANHTIADAAIATHTLAFVLLAVAIHTYAIESVGVSIHTNAIVSAAAATHTIPCTAVVNPFYGLIEYRSPHLSTPPPNKQQGNGLDFVCVGCAKPLSDDDELLDKLHSFFFFTTLIIQQEALASCIIIISYYQNPYTINIYRLSQIIILPLGL